MTVAERVAKTRRAYVKRLFTPQRNAEAARLWRAGRWSRVPDLLAAIPSKQQYARAFGRRRESVADDRFAVRRMRRDRNHRLISTIILAETARLLGAAGGLQGDFFADAAFVSAIAFDAATDATVRLSVTKRELSEARGVLIVGRTLSELLREASRRLAGRLRGAPAAAATSASRSKTSMERELRRVARAALRRFRSEVDLLLGEFWFAAVQRAWAAQVKYKAARRPRGRRARRAS